MVCQWLQSGYWARSVSYTHLDVYKRQGKSSVSQNNVAAYTTYGTSRANAYKILEDSLNPVSYTHLQQDFL